MPNPRPLLSSPRELVVVTRAEADVKVTDGHVTSNPDFSVERINDLLTSDELSLRPLFGLSEDRLRIQAHSIEVDTGIPPTDLTVFKRLYAPDYRLEELAERMIAEESVEGAYIKPGALPAIWVTDMEPDRTAAPRITEDFTGRQGYLEAADEGGIDARFAWGKPGGRGDGIKMIDVEGAWRFEHDDLTTNLGGCVAGLPFPDSLWRDHGTAVLGIVGGDENKRGVTGICHRTIVSGVSIFELAITQGWGSAAAITAAANKLGKGDILLIELQRAGPRVNFVKQDSQFGNIPVEWWPDDFNAIKAATDRGVLVVTAGGNGNQDLGDPFYDVPPDLPYLKFPADWANPFRRGTRDSGSIIVGAGGPKIEGITSVPDLCRIEVSNFDLSNEVSIFDAQGWGEQVTTTGFGDLERGSGPDENFWYTGRFSGTSSAAAMIAGALACLQGIQEAHPDNRPRLTPAEARALLRATGRPQQDHPTSPVSKRIGNRPDLRELIEGLPT